MNWPEIMKHCFDSDAVFYSGHARREMQGEEFGSIMDGEVYEAVCNCEIIEDYPDDSPYPSVLIYGITKAKRRLHIVCAYDKEEEKAVIRILR